MGKLLGAASTKLNEEKDVSKGSYQDMSAPLTRKDKKPVRRKVFKLKGRQAVRSSTSAPATNESRKTTKDHCHPGDEKSQASTLADMERQLRSNLPLKLPSSAEARAELEQSLSHAPPTGEIDPVVCVPDTGSRRSQPRKYTRSLQVGHWVVATDWPFTPEAIAGIPFAEELWMMMSSFGDPRGEVVCRCEARGKVRCKCLDAVVALEPLVHSFGTRLVAICQEWSSPGRFRIKHLRIAMPGEMREFMAWKDAHSKWGSKFSDEKKAGVAVGDDDIDHDEEADDDNDSADDEDEGEKARGLADRDWSLEEEEVAGRILHRQRFADDTTADMEEASYVRLYSECRKAFFIMPRSWRRPSQPGSRRYFVKYLGLADSKEGTDRKLLDALAYMMYDYVGLLVENSIRNRTGGRLEALPKDKNFSTKLTGEEIKAAATKVAPLLGRREREHIREARAANPNGISMKTLPGVRVGLQYHGNPLKWPCNTVDSARVQLDGGSFVDTSDGKLAAEAVEILKSDFADLADSTDFDS